MSAPEAEQMNTGLEVNKSLKAAAKLLVDVVKKSDEAGKPSQRARDGLTQIQTWGDEVLKTRLKI
jgi:hypothetical protein